MLTVLVVEDEFGVADVVVTALEDEGYRVLVAANGRQGMERLADTKPDLIIADFMMPDMNGAELIERVRAEAEISDIPIVIYTAYSQEDIEPAMQAGATKAFFKPFDLDNLIDYVLQLSKPANKR